MIELGAIETKFILHWGEMGPRWGINRTVAQIHALLYLSEEPLNAEQIADTLTVARSNVSNSLKELQGWGLIKNVHRLGDRRDHFESKKDMWEMARLITAERKRREFDPTVVVLRECIDEIDSTGGGSDYTRERVSATLKFIETATDVYEELQSLPVETIMKVETTKKRLKNLIKSLTG